MGLDMYLQRKRYVKNWDHNPSEKFFFRDCISRKQTDQLRKNKFNYF